MRLILLNPRMWLRKASVTFLIKLAASVARGGAEPWTTTIHLCVTSLTMSWSHFCPGSCRRFWPSHQPPQPVFPTLRIWQSKISHLVYLSIQATFWNRLFDVFLKRITCAITRHWLHSPCYLALAALTTSVMVITINISQIHMITTAAARLIGFFSFITSLERILQSSMTYSGIIFNATATPRGTKIRSSRYPKTGMKSGIRSIGLNAYPTTRATNALAYQGTLGSL